MRTPFLVLIGLLISYSFSTAQTSAVTSTGDEVILYEDGTWKYADGKLPSEEEIPVNSKKFKKDKSSTFLIESSRVDLGFYINPKKWSFNKDSDINSEAEYELRLKDGDLYGMIISEKFEMPLTTLRDLAVENGRKVAPDLRIVNEEYRTVNGLKFFGFEWMDLCRGLSSHTTDTTILGKRVLCSSSHTPHRIC